MTNTAQLGNLTIQQLQALLANQSQQQIIYPQVSGKGQPLMTIDNAREVIKFYNMTVRYNSMTKQTEIDIPNFSKNGDLYNNAVIGQMLSMFHQQLFPIGKDRLMDFINAIAHENQYHPVRDWIDQQVWDGRSRLLDYYNSITLTEDNPMKETMMRKWALSLMGALYHNNFSCEGVLTFTGKQGIGKTTWIEELLPVEGRNNWTKDSVIIDMKNKDTIFKALGNWIVELGELDATFKKSDIEALKGFITEKRDMLRNPYDRVANEYPRQTVFYATVNETEFLQDEENRRFWVLSVDSFNHGLIDPAQFWAEMKQIYLQVAGKIVDSASRKANNEWGWFMSPLEREQMKPLQETFRNIDPVEQTLERYLKPVIELTNKREWMTATDIIDRCAWTKPNRRELNIVTKWLRKHGYQTDRQKKWSVEFYNQTVLGDVEYDTAKVNTKLLERLKK